MLKYYYGTTKFTIFWEEKSIFSLLFLSTPASSVMGQISRQLQFNSLSLSLLNTHTQTRTNTHCIYLAWLSPSFSYLSIFISFLSFSLICLDLMFSRPNLLLHFSNSLLFSYLYFLSLFHRICSFFLPFLCNTLFSVRANINRVSGFSVIYLRNAQYTADFFLYP